MNELERLIAEQEADDTNFVRPEAQNVSLESVSDYIGTSDTYFAGTADEDYSFGDGEVHSFLTSAKGSVLVAGASWHGTRYGYTMKGCKCERCTEANKLYHRERRRKARG